MGCMIASSQSSDTRFTLHFGADHGGFDLKEALIQRAKKSHYSVVDHGAFAFDPSDDYPQFAFAVAQAVTVTAGSLSVSNQMNLPRDFGVLLCRSGGGMTIAANKVKGARAVAVTDARSCEHAMVHNNANCIVLAADWLSGETQAWELVDLCLAAAVSPAERHMRRLAQIASYEMEKYQA